MWTVHRYVNYTIKVYYEFMEYLSPNLEKVPYASFKQRTLSFVIDFLIIYGVPTAIVLILPLLSRLIIKTEIAADSDLILILGISMTFLLSISDFLVISYLNSGKTIGKMLIKIRIIDLSNNNPSLSQLLLRTLIGYPLFFLSNLLLGASSLLLAINPKKRGIHDFISRTYVVSDRTNNPQVRLTFAQSFLPLVVSLILPFILISIAYKSYGASIFISYDQRLVGNQILKLSPYRATQNNNIRGYLTYTLLHLYDFEGKLPKPSLEGDGYLLLDRDGTRTKLDTPLVSAFERINKETTKIRVYYDNYYFDLHIGKFAEDQYYKLENNIWTLDSINNRVFELDQTIHRDPTPYGKILLFRNNGFYIYDFTLGKEESLGQAIYPKKIDFESVRVAANGNSLVFTIQDNDKTWISSVNTQTKKQTTLSNVYLPDSKNHSYKVSPSGKYLSVPINRLLRIYNLETDTLVWENANFDYQTNTWAPNQDLLAYSTNEGFNIVKLETDQTTVKTVKLSFNKPEYYANSYHQWISDNQLYYKIEFSDQELYAHKTLPSPIFAIYNIDNGTKKTLKKAYEFSSLNQSYPVTNPELCYKFPKGVLEEFYKFNNSFCDSLYFYGRANTDLKLFQSGKDGDYSIYSVNSKNVDDVYWVTKGRLLKWIND